MLPLLLLSACTSLVPEQIRQPVAVDITVSQVQQDPQRFLNSPVRWGGEIIAVDNRVGETWIEVLSRKLGSSGRPDEERRGEGRFLVRVEGFLDPADYAAGCSFTVTGRVTGSRTQAVGEYPYLYPLVEAEAYYLWPPLEKAPQRHPFYDPFYDPFFDPWCRYRYPGRFYPCW